ncbi:MAG TPA: D-alanyl-D-alanine carboxypeptidase/D-alanyl-D-alanine-endopeptidase [Acidimicrobiales bacterium]
MNRWATVATAVAAVGVLALPALGLSRLADAAGTTASRGTVPTSTTALSLDPAATLPASSIVPGPSSTVAATTVQVTVPAQGRVVTPVLSTRRLPGLVADKPPTESLLKALKQIAPDLKGVGCLSVMAGSEVYATSGDVALIPGSNQKLLVAAVALERLGEQARFTTSLVSANQATDGVITGDLFLVGGGDPMLSTQQYLATAARMFRFVPTPATSLEDLVDALAEAGITKITGRIVGDDTRYDSERAVPTWSPDYRANLEVAPLSALLLDDGIANLTNLRQTNDPATHAANVLTTLLKAKGIAVDGEPTSGKAPDDGLEVASVSSAPLAEILPDLLRDSDNTTAELLLKELAVDAGVVPGTRVAGLAAVREQLEQWGIPLAGLNMVDASGLDRANRVSCRTLAHLLARYPVEHDLVQSLAIAGRSGTLTKSFVGNPMENRLFGKTGTLTGVKALSGVVPEDEGPPLAFSLLLNHSKADTLAPKLWDRLGKALNQYPTKVDLGPYGPLPPVTAVG